MNQPDFLTWIIFPYVWRFENLENFKLGVMGIMVYGYKRIRGREEIIIKWS